MTMWIFILIAIVAVTACAILYLAYCWRRTVYADQRKSVRGLLVPLAAVMLFFTAAGLLLNFINAVVVVTHIAVVMLAVEFTAFCLRRCGVRFSSKLQFCSAMLLSAAALGWGWYCDHHVWRTEYSLTTAKNIPDLKILMFADSHVGATFGADGFAKHVEVMKEENADAVFIVGDFVDDDTSKEDMIASCRLMAELKAPYGVYFVLGNHDRGYYGSARRGFSVTELTDELQKNGVTVLKDQIVSAGGINVAGRLDYSVVREQHGTRLSPAELMAKAAPGGYTVVLDHQPVEYDLLGASGADLVLSGHTHGGQLFPLNQVGRMIGAVDRVYGHEKRGSADFIVTSGISNWALKFKTGTRSEYVVINIKGAGGENR